MKKYGDDRGGSAAALITFYGFLSVFPLLLLLITLAGVILGPHSSAEHRIVNSALSEFPVIGTKLGQSIHALHSATPLAFVVSVLGVLWGSLGITNNLQQASATFWGVPRDKEAGLPQRVGRGLLLLGTIGVSVVGGGALAGVSAIGGGQAHTTLGRTLTYLLPLLGAAALNLVTYLVALRVLSPPRTHWRALLPGTLVGGIGWTVLQAVGGLLIEHNLRHSTELYGFFAIVLGLVAWLSLGSQLFAYASETNVVLIRHAWPRHLTDAAETDTAPSDGADGRAQVSTSANS